MQLNVFRWHRQFFQGQHRLALKARLFAFALFAGAGLVCAFTVPFSISSEGTQGTSPMAQNSRAGQDSGFVGSGVCGSCHQAEAEAWKKSHHALAMQDATEAAVLGDFNNASAEHFSSKARFYRKDGRFFVATEGKDGKEAGFEVQYTFGLTPLQQYLARFPDGRLQALPYAWDSMPKSDGGQRWFHLYPGEDIPPADPLHWTGPQQNWNYMCAECHSTNVRKNYDAASDSFHTTFSEVSLGCEACHGPGAGHARWAASGRLESVAHHGFDFIPPTRSAISWQPDWKTGSASVSVSVPAGSAMETCDRCHSRRGEFSEAWHPGQPLTETHLPAFLTSDLFEDDGQMKDEVFNTSSFQQSKMFAKGVICTDCHDAHSGKLKAAGSEVCAQCHAPEKFAASKHTGHAPDPGAPDCVACHMSVRTFMGVDRRHDHSFRIPRPDLTDKLGTPNTCSSCHTDRDAAWAAAAVERWHGPVRKGFQTYAEAFHAARLDLPEASGLLVKVAQDAATPAIARATALLLLRDKPSKAAKDVIERGLHDPEPMVRIGSLRALELQPQDLRWTLGKASLSDSISAVRMQAASLLADVPLNGLNAQEKIALDQASEEYIAARQFNADRAEERTNLAGFYVRQGKPPLAEHEYLAAIRLAPRQVPPRVDLADLYRATGREAEAETLLRQTISAVPDAAAAHHALGLSLIRQKRYAEAIQSLKHAAQLEPSQPRYDYVYAIALQSAGQPAEAHQVLIGALHKSPSNVDILTVLLQDSLKTRNLKEALSYAERLSVLRPNDSNLALFTGQLRAAAQ
jgi:predicted CXXCH cytochrome family protein